MHLTIHRPLVQDAAAHAARSGAAPPSLPPPARRRRRIRAAAALTLAHLARHLDGETARRAVA